MLIRLYLIRHGETAWSRSGRHTSRTEVPLTADGEASALHLAGRLSGETFSEILTSPRLRARQTCELAGFGTCRQIEPDLTEWDYGDYEGLTSTEILRLRPDWNIFRDGCPGGESPADVSARADRLLSRLRLHDGSIIVFSHGHFGRVLATRWLNAPIEDGRRLLLSPASISILGYEHAHPNAPVIVRWNDEG